ncbi:cysteine hydrolase family protein [Megasphaera sueciensis]|uniref:cysteine hydrolase family protein n=1 Tax=Megasphaera sueciensis TaxID=349094 RepID=UPI003D06FC67
MKQAYIIIDMQNDFITGTLGSTSAQRIVPRIEEEIIKVKKNAADTTELIFTQDTHDERYLDTQEGKNLPIQHCQKDSHGWNICRDLLPYTLDAVVLEKSTFGCTALIEAAAPYDTLVLMGLCTDICIISNALLLKAFYPEKNIIVYSSCCAGSTEEAHQTALTAMQACQIHIIR